MRTANDQADQPARPHDETLSGKADQPAAASSVPALGTRVGRYVVGAPLGAGAMGVVFAAHDPELDRKVAIKLLRPRHGPVSQVARRRLLREAQALARLNDECVVSVLDVGVHEGRVFMAMEYVQGKTLAAWLTSDDGRRQPRPWPEVLEVFERAGRGLAAAHRHGLVHRDFKPHNVMLERGALDRVRVMDFGLARANDEGESARANHQSELSFPPGLQGSLTQTGALLGTPAYMAPEQFSGEVTARSDQFAFCVALFEALYGALPFRGETVMERSTAVLSGKMIVPQRPAGMPAIPRWLRAVIFRGLQSDPHRRFPDMQTLLRALRVGAARATRARALTGLAVAGLMTAAWAGHGRWQDARVADACVENGDALGEVWSDTRRASVRTSLLATHVPYAESTATRVLTHLDAQADAIRAAEREVCRAVQQDERWDDELAGRAAWCLGERRMQLEAMIDELSVADPSSAARAVAAVSALSQVSPCTDVAFLMRASAPPQERGSAKAITKMLSRVDVLRSGGRYEPALELARDALEQSEGLESAALTASARLQLGSAHFTLGQYDLAKASLEAAYFEATQAGASDVQLDAARTLIRVHMRLNRQGEAQAWARHAEAALSVLGEPPDSLRRVEVDESLAWLDIAAGRYGEAKARFERALEVRRRIFDSEHPSVARALSNLAFAHYQNGSYTLAKELHQRALAATQEALGPDHPDVARALRQLAADHYDTGAYDEALTEFERALTIAREAYGPEHLFVAEILNNMALVHRAKGNYDEAIRQTERALAIAEKVLGPDHLDVAAPRDNLGILYRQTSAFDEARAQHERALAIREAALGPDHADVATSLYNLALVHQTVGSFEEAREGFERSLTILEAALGPEHPRVAHPLQSLADVAMLQERPSLALPFAERSVAIRSSAEVPAEMLAESRFVLARALWDAPVAHGRDRERARMLALQARDAYRGDPSQAGRLEDVERWLASRPAPGR